ncbi:uncharacterized protein LOC122740143 [Dromiciops gliroides]|uniref:uncharacterized protein LOC122740143 n=1 Tax=Dromiciops gliroides TaxID=33562 RepID=UPI001CC3AC78|nr:uncharacterized protein LOC122740143 [Dromiciops gliroides]
MLKIWGLILFYGLLTQSSAYRRRQKLILTQPQKHVFVQADASAQAEASSSLLLKAANSLHIELLNTNTPSNLKKLPFMKALNTIQHGWLGNSHAGVDAKFLDLEISSIKVTKAQIFKMNITQSEDRRQLLATYPATLDMEANILFLGNIGFRIDIVNMFRIGTEIDEHEDGYLAIQDCNTDLVNFKVKTHIRVINDVLDAFVSLLDAVVPQLVEEALCSAVSTCLPRLGFNLKTALVDALTCGHDLSVN